MHYRHLTTIDNAWGWMERLQGLSSLNRIGCTRVAIISSLVLIEFEPSETMGNGSPHAARLSESPRRAPAPYLLGSTEIYISEYTSNSKKSVTCLTVCTLSQFAAQVLQLTCDIVELRLEIRQFVFASNDCHS
jgi:hypothetical protein